MRIDLSGVIISGKRLEKMVDFLFDISNRVDLVSSDYEEMTKQEYEAAKIEGDQIKRELDYANGLTDEEIDEIYKDWIGEDSYLSDLSEAEREKELEFLRKLRESSERDDLIRENSFKKTGDDINAVVKEKFKGLGCLQRQVTCQTHCTIGEPTVVYSFPVSKKLKEYFQKMELLTWPLRRGDGTFLADDPAFYQGEDIVCSICSHEGYITLYLNQEQAEKFYSLGIPYYLEITEEKPDFPFIKETVRVLSMSGTIATLLGLELFDTNLENLLNYQEFYRWFDEHVKDIRKEFKPCRKSVKEIVEYLLQKYSMEPYHSEAIELQCKRHGWDNFFAKPLNSQVEDNNNTEDNDNAEAETTDNTVAVTIDEGGFRNQCGESEITIPKLAPFLYRINYQGEELLVGGEYNSEYIFADVLGAEEGLRKLVKNIDEDVYAITGQGSMSGPLFCLLREINIVRGIDEFEMYDNVHFRTYIQILKYEDFRT